MLTENSVTIDRPQLSKSATIFMVKMAQIRHSTPKFFFNFWGTLVMFHFA